ncbi:gephyrin-like molybdotransferase Glp [Mangrovicella endophytica]|uniref:molybdopterin molybdotransferase MoeA n=1 Tax=Mangrovicella endophytica TaxID=2066697 RepID=UPI000C9E3718|nr:gephyrin-like molybdotransferase Glp [Mangrovicella endophytica]
MISVAEALQRILDDAAAVPDTETVDLSAACGRILASPVSANRTQPGFAASAMDGYAVRAGDLAADINQPLTVIGESAAGSAFTGTVRFGEAVRIFTGAPVPDGADAVLIQENAEKLPDSRIRPTAPVAAGRNIRPAGTDFQAGSLLIAACRRLTPGTVALAASAGHPRLVVLRRPRVAILATGDELVRPGEPLGPSQIVASNSYGVAALVEAAGGRALDYGIAPDDEAEISARLDQALAEKADVFVTIGGASVGDHDLVGTVFASRGIALDFWKVAMRPGKPLMAGRLGDMRILGLPGNPASSMVTANLFLRPLIKRLAGWPDEIGEEDGVLGADLAANDVRTDFLRARIEPRSTPPRLLPLARQDSSLLSVYAEADALLIRPPLAPAAQAGEPCRFIRL